MWSEANTEVFLERGDDFTPGRRQQFAALAALVAQAAPAPRIVELGCGDGALAAYLLERLPGASVRALDGSPTMVEAARERLARFGPRATVGAAELTSEAWAQAAQAPQAVVSSLALHHLGAEAKRALFARAHETLARGGVLAVADVIEPAGPRARRVAAAAWDEAVRHEAPPGAFTAFEAAGWNLYRHGDAEGIDHPDPLRDQLGWLEAAGFGEVDVVWMRAGHAVYFGAKAP